MPANDHNALVADEPFVEFDEEDELFVEFDEEPENGWDISSESDDRTLLYALWCGLAQGREVPPLEPPEEELWEILHERYPWELRIFAIVLDDRLYRDGFEGYTPDQAIDAIGRIADPNSASLVAMARDLLACWELDHKIVLEIRGHVPGVPHAKLQALRDRIGTPAEGVWDDGGPAARVAQFRVSVVRQLHDETIDGKALIPPSR